MMVNANPEKIAKRIFDCWQDDLKKINKMSIEQKRKISKSVIDFNNRKKNNEKLIVIAEGEQSCGMSHSSLYIAKQMDLRKVNK